MALPLGHPWLRTHSWGSSISPCPESQNGGSPTRCSRVIRERRANLRNSEGGCRAYTTCRRLSPGIVAQNWTNRGRIGDAQVLCDQPPPPFPKRRERRSVEECSDQNEQYTCIDPVVITGSMFDKKVKGERGLHTPGRTAWVEAAILRSEPVGNLGEFTRGKRENPTSSSTDNTTTSEVDPYKRSLLHHLKIRAHTQHRLRATKSFIFLTGGTLAVVNRYLKGNRQNSVENSTIRTRLKQKAKDSRDGGEGIIMLR
ncbi:hypothetical protein BJY52DRAFT_1419655 [Lactarius psammicola]|nr:hypothetical protein BJY52DRAFT_1419655 [Lactarius psammicola]